MADDPETDGNKFLRIQPLPWGGWVVYAWSHRTGDYTRPMYACSNEDEARDYMNAQLLGSLETPSAADPQWPAGIIARASTEGLPPMAAERLPPLVK